MPREVDSMVERMARKLQERTSPGGGSWERLDHRVRQVWRRDARELLAAMREPTPQMIKEGRWPAHERGASECWQAMIDAALAEPSHD